jgi:citrate synthase
MISIESLVKTLQSIRDENDLPLEDLLLAFVAIAPLALSSQLAASRSWRMNTQNEDLGHAANLLWMTGGEMPSEEKIREFDTCLILHMDDPDNPSLRALHASIESGASVPSALESALLEHVKPSHHGAGLEAMRMILAIGKKENTSEYLRARLSSGQRISGLGHRIYRRTDPRAAVLREILARRTSGTDDEELFRIAEEVAERGSSLLHEYKRIKAFPNVDLYNALTYYTFGFPPELNTELFAVSRAAGWMAHILEWERHP